MTCTCSRRRLIGTSLSCAAWVALGMRWAPSALAQAFAETRFGAVVGTEPFGRVERLAEGVWAVVATPFSQGMGNPQRTLFSNGGIISGPDAVVCIEGFMTPAGAAWQSALAEELTGRRPTHVVVTHHHPDHTAGLIGYQRGAEGPALYALEETRALLRDRIGANPTPVGDEVLVEASQRVVLPEQVIINLTDEGAGGIDLGDGRRLWFRPRSGHTPGDLVIELTDPRIVWTGDLCFNGLFPYYGDALPARLGEVSRELLTDPETTYVPGHGAVSDAEGLRPYLAVLEDVERAARETHAAGTPAEEAWQTYEVPESLGEWAKFRPDVHRFAFEAWYRELG